MSAVVVVRGTKGQKQRQINILWVTSGSQYTVRLRFAGQPLVTFPGKDLINGRLTIKLPANEQEIIELTKL